MTLLREHKTSRHWQPEYVLPRMIPASRESRMNLHHAATLALVGWYLMAPPPQIDPKTGLPTGHTNLLVPFKYWENEGSFDSAKECSAEKWSNFSLLLKLSEKPVHLTEQQEEHIDRDILKRPKGWSHALGNCSLFRAGDAKCVATDDLRLKGK